MPSTQLPPCNSTNNSINSHKDLSNHTTSVHGSQKTTCPTCNKLISSKNFPVHLKTHLAVGERVKFKCSVAQCSKRFFCKSKLKRHVVLDHSVTPRKKHKCDHCSKECTEMGNLRAHIRKYHPDSVIKYSCNLCEATFKSTDERAYHNAKAHPDPEVFKCSADQCFKKYPRRSSLWRHVHECHSDSFTKFPCSLCPSEFMSKTGRDDHVVSVHTGEKAFPCSECPLKFPTSSQLTGHRFVHTEQRPNKCMACSKYFKRQDYLKNHFSRVHSKKPKHLKCSTCGKAFSFQADLTQHLRSHNLELGPFSCYFFGSWGPKKFTTHSYLVGHLRIHTQENPYFCSEDSCKYSTKYPTSLRNHKKRYHLRETAPRIWSCYFCSKTYPKFSHLVSHIRIHTLEAPFPCAMCQKLFTSSASLRRHIFTHTKEKPFSCPKCSKWFITRGDVRGHVASTHNKEKRFFCEFCNYSSYGKHDFSRHQLRQHY